MKLFWDVDGTLFAYDGKHPAPLAAERQLRPHAEEVISTLEQLGVEHYVWSRAGKENACSAAQRLGIPAERCFAKPEFEAPEDLGKIPVTPDLVIDDRDDESVLIFPHIVVDSYRGGDDETLLKIMGQVREYFDATEGGLSEVKVKIRKRTRTPMAVQMKRKQYYRKHRSKYRRYRKAYRRRPRAKRINKIRKRLTRRFGDRLKRMRTRISVEALP